MFIIHFDFELSDSPTLTTHSKYKQCVRHAKWDTRGLNKTLCV